MQDQNLNQTATPIARPNAMTQFPDALPTPLIKFLPEDYRPNPSTSCETCPNAVFFLALDGLIKCHCSAMSVISWQTGEKNPITECDGREMALLAQRAKAERQAEREAKKASAVAETQALWFERHNAKETARQQREAEKEAKAAAKAATKSATKAAE